MSTTLDENLNIISENENLEIEMLNGDLNIISKLDDEPNDVGGLSAAQLKREFDKAGLIIQKYINETLIPAILENDATEATRAAAEAARQEAEINRLTAEEKRVKAENGRVEAETGRATAETSRATAETSRATAEQIRVANENARIKVEQDRVVAEKKRVAAESSRNVWEQYNALKEYKPGNKVGYKGSSYVNINASYGVAPDAEGGSNYWLMIAAKGKEGVDISGSEIDSNGHLILIYTDGSRVDCGAIASSVDWMENDPASPHYVKNRTHWEQVMQEGGSILAAKDLAFFASLAFLNGVGLGQIVVGKRFTVTWNGTAYECEAALLYEGAASSLILGNAALLGGENDTGEPFCLSDFESSGCAVTKSTEDAETVTIQIDETRVVVVHHLDPKFLPDGVPYIEDGGMVEILPECQPAFVEDNSAFMIQGTQALEVGSTYKVNWNGVEYTCVGLDGTALGETGTIVLGDVYTASGGNAGTSPTGEPFIIMYFLQDGVSGMMMMALDGTTELTISIYQGDRTIRKLDNRCLDLAWLPTAGKKEILPATTFESGMSKSVGGYDSIPLGTIFVIVDGVLYETTHFMTGEGANGSSLFGNLYYVDQNMPNTGEPFYGLCYSDKTSFNFADGASHVASILTPEYNKLPSGFLPDDATVFYLTSPGGKKFAVTVSDDGTLSAAGVTA